VSNDLLTSFPKKCSAERPIPADIWPDNKGLMKAKYDVKPSKKDPLVMEITGDIHQWEPTAKAWREFWKRAVNFSLVSIDTETTGLRPFHGSKIVGVSGAFWDGKKIQAGYWNFRHLGHAAHGDHDSACKKSKGCTCESYCAGYKESAPIVPLSELACLEPVYRDCIVGGQNFKYDAKMGHVDGLSIPRRVLDTQLIAHLYDENARRYNLDILAKEMGELKLRDVIHEYMKQHGLTYEQGHAQVPYEVERPYAIMDTVLVLRRLQWERERWVDLEDHRLMDIFQVENACTHAYAFTEIPGMKLDDEYTRKGVKQLEAEAAVLEQQIYKEAGKVFDKSEHKFSIRSNEQLWAVLEAKGFKALSLTPGGDPALDDVNLDNYHDKLCTLVREYRGKTKMLGTYFKPFLEDWVDEKGVLQRAHSDPDGHIHSDYFIHGTVSGRTSSRDPNLQNVPKYERFGTRTRSGQVAKAVHSGLKTEKLKSDEDMLEVRRCFVPRGPEYSLFFMDYAQMELRVFADYADEEFMRSELDRGVDLHASVAKEVFPNVPSKEENPTIYAFFRQLTKQINFGILYGMGVAKLALQLDVPIDECVRLLQLAKLGIEKDPDYVQDNNLCTYTVDEIDAILEDHRVMYQSRQWQGIQRLNKEVPMKVNPTPLEKMLIKDGENLRLMYSAKGFMQKYHARFPKVKIFMKAIEQAIKTRGYVFNRFGRRYHLPPEKSYVGVNRLVQGTCGDMKKLALVRIARLLEDKKARTKVINDVHDEIQFDVHHQELDLVPQIRACMETFSQVGIRMHVDIDYSHVAWSEKRPWSSEDEFRKSLAEHLGQSKKTVKKPKARS